MRGHPKSKATQIDRGIKPLPVWLRVKIVPINFMMMLLLALLVLPVSSAGLERPKYRTAYACEGSTLNMDCDQGHMINLIRANYGRFSITICNEEGNTEWSVNCMSRRSHRVLHDRCSQKQNCSVPASTRGFGDPCPGTLKYLEAHFQCVPVNPPSLTSRPRPPWFVPAATVPSIEYHADPHKDSPFPRDNPQSMFPEMVPGKGGPLDSEVDHSKLGDPPKGSSSSTTSTIKPPPWLIANTTPLNITTPTTPPTTIHFPSSTTSSLPSTSSPRPSSSVIPSRNPNNRSNNIDQPDDKYTNEIPNNNNNRHQFATSTLSTTSAWAPRGETPVRIAEEDQLPWCPPSSGRGLFWNWTSGGEIATQPCPGGASGDATRQCLSQGGWVSSPDLSRCRSVWLTTLLTRADDKDSVLAVAQDLSKVTKSKKLYGGDITAAARLVSELTERMGDDVSSFPDGAQLEAVVTELVLKALATVSNLVGRQQLAWGDLRASEHNYAITKLLLGLEEAAFFLADNIHHEKTITHAVSNILMRLQVLETRNVGPVTFPAGDDPWPSPESLTQTYPEVPLPPTDHQPMRHLQDFITLPPEALLENSENGLVKMVFFSYDGMQSLLQPQASYRYRDSPYQTGNQSRILNSRVVSASLGAGRHIELSEPVYITFSMIQTVNVTNPACVFWDYTTSSWSEEGCRVLRFNTTHTTCQCDHLTNFAVLMDVHSTPLAATHQMALSVITYVGCVISIVCLLLATIVFHAFRGLKNDRTIIHKNLCICLMIAEALFVGGIARTDQPVVCSVVAGFLHYFFLAAFAWMFLEGFQLYMLLTEVFEVEESRSRWYYLTAYGVPLLVVGVSAIIDPHSYGTDTVCWLRTDNYFIFAFVGPVLLVLVANSVFLTISLITMCRHSHNSAALKNKETSRLASLRSWIRGAIVLMFLLGLTWTFGLLYLDEASVAMAYVFTILNSLQGLFIFVFHCLQNEKKYSFKSCGRDSGHGGSEQEESPRTGPQAKLSSLRLNNNITGPLSQPDLPQLVNPFAAAAALEHSSPNNAPAILPDYRFATEVSNLRYPTMPGFRQIHRNQSPWNHTYTEIADGIVVRPMDPNAPPSDPVYEEIEREGRSEIQVSDLSDEDGRRQSSDISRQSSRSYGDHRPLLPYTLPDRNPTLSTSDPRFCYTTSQPQQEMHHHTMSPGNRIHPTIDHTIVSGGHVVPLSHPNPTVMCSPHHISMNGHIGAPMDPQQYQEAMLASLGHNPTIVQPLSEPNLRSWEAVQRHRDLQQLQHLGEMTVAVLSGEQVVCKLKSPLAPIHENSAPTTTVGGQAPTMSHTPTSERYLTPQTYSHC